MAGAGLFAAAGAGNISRLTQGSPYAGLAPSAARLRGAWVAVASSPASAWSTSAARSTRIRSGSSSPTASDHAHQRTPSPFGRHNYIVDLSSHSHGVNYRGAWTAEVTGWSEHFLRFIAAAEGEGQQLD